MAKGSKPPKPRGTKRQREGELKARREGALDGPDVGRIRRAVKRSRKK